MNYVQQLNNRRMLLQCINTDSSPLKGGLGQDAVRLLMQSGLDTDNEKMKLYETGVAYIHEMLPNGPKSRAAVERSRLFWGFWDMQWRIRNNRLYYGVFNCPDWLRAHEVRQMWENCHDIDRLLIEGRNDEMKKEFWRIVSQIKIH